MKKKTTTTKQKENVEKRRRNKRSSFSWTCHNISYGCERCAQTHLLYECIYSSAFLFCWCDAYCLTYCKLGGIFHRTPPTTIIFMLCFVCFSFFGFFVQCICRRSRTDICVRKDILNRLECNMINWECKLWSNNVFREHMQRQKTVVCCVNETLFVHVDDCVRASVCCVSVYKCDTFTRMKEIIFIIPDTLLCKQH